MAELDPAELSLMFIVVLIPNIISHFYWRLLLQECVPVCMSVVLLIMSMTVLERHPEPTVPRLECHQCSRDNVQLIQTTCSS